MSDSLSAALIGHGNRLDAISALLEEKKVVHRRWMHTDPRDTLDFGPLTDFRLVFIEMPIADLETSFQQFSRYLSGRHALVHMCHEVSGSPIRTPAKLIHQYCPSRRLAFLSGPMQLRSGSDNEYQGSGIVATEFPEIVSLLSDCLTTNHFRLYATFDIHGAQLSATYGRIIAAAAGTTVALGLDRSMLATLYARGLAETARFVSALGGNTDTCFGLAGAGNIFVDIDPENPSIDYQIGERLIGCNLDALESEFGPSFGAFQNVVQTLKDTISSKDSFPILDVFGSILEGSLDAAEALEYLAEIPLIWES
jgi:glycerol-3-phosphate dehydrogenase (NAD(P)+)